MATLKNTTINDTGFIDIPSGTIAQRPSSPAAGMYRFNTDLNCAEFYNGTSWVNPTTGQLPIVTSGLVFYVDAGVPASYPGATSTTYYDLSPSGNYGFGNTAPTFSATNGGYFSFNGSSNMIIFPNNTALNSQAITMESWVYPTTLTQNGFLFEKGQVNTQYSYFFSGDGVFYFRTMGLSNQDLAFTSSTGFTANTWHQVVATYASGTKTVYVNTTSRASATGVTGTIGTDAGGMSIGVHGGYSGTRGYYLSGRIAITRVYNRALSSTEITQNFNANRGRFGI